MKLGIVIPWFGRELKGGAEQQAWQVASRLAARGHEIEVLTNGNETYPCLYDDLRDARQSITMQMYYCQPGKVADFVVVDGDPFEVATLAARIESVYVGGVRRR